MSTTNPPDPLTPPHLTSGGQRILETAAELFYTHGIHAVGVDTIATESGMTKRTLYNRFESKDGLVVAYLQLRHDSWWRRLKERLDRISDSDGARARILAVIDSYSIDSQSTDRGCGFVNAAAELPHDHPGRTVIRAHKRQVMELIAELLTDGEFSNADGLAEHIFLILEGAIVHRGIDGNDSRLRLARELIAQLLS